mgnify:CR=1 FL=1
MSEINDLTTFFSTGAKHFARLNNILIIPFGKQTERAEDIPEAITLVNNSMAGSYLKINSPTVIIDTKAHQPLCIKHIPEIIPEEIKTINDEQFEGSNRNWKYFQYLKDVYIEKVGLNLGEKGTKEEKEFLDHYFQLCWLQLEERKKEERCTPAVKHANTEEDLIANRSREEGDSYFPLNDSRSIYEALLPIYEPHLFFDAVGFSNRRQQTEEPNILDEGYCESEQYILPTFKEPTRTQENKKFIPPQDNKKIVYHTKIDFVFWTGKRFLFYEIDGDEKLLSQYLDKTQNMQLDDCFSRNFQNKQLKDLDYLISEQGPEYLEREKKLQDDFPDELLHYWQLTPSDSPFRKLWSVGSYSYHAATEAGVDVKEKYRELPYHFSYEKPLDFERTD